jgi:hypothetical protein
MFRKCHDKEALAEPTSLVAEATYLSAELSLGSAELNYVAKVFIYSLFTRLWVAFIIVANIELTSP